MIQTPLGPFAVGETAVTIFNAGDLNHSLLTSLGLPESAWKGRYDTLFVGGIPVPVQCILIQTAGATVLVDAGAFEPEPSNPALVIPGYTPPPSLITQLAGVGVGPADITHIVISHTHFDHFNGLSAVVDGRAVALYPHAQVLVGRADLAKLSSSQEYIDGVSPAARMFGPYEADGRLILVDDEVSPAPGVDVMPSPSETPGHLSVRVQSEGRTLYCVGDLYHHYTEVENREWMATWADKELTVAERLKLEDVAVAENAMLIASHIRGVGRLARTADGVRWQELVVD